MPKRKIYMAVTKDALSLPLAVADSVAELAEQEGFYPIDESVEDDDLPF